MKKESLLKINLLLSQICAAECNVKNETDKKQNYKNVKI
jgi:hypothetical protein